MRIVNDKGYPYNYILHLVDHAGSLHRTRPCTSKTMGEVIRNLLQILLETGVPDILQFDNEKEFKNTVMGAMKKALYFETAHGRAHNPEANECVERSHFFLCQKLAFLKQSTESKNWASLLPVACAMLNNTVTRKTQLTPHEFIFGRRLFSEEIAADLGVLVDIFLDDGEPQLDDHSDAEEFLGCVPYKGILSRPPPKDDHDSAEDVPDAVSEDDDESRLQIPLRLMPSQSRKHSKDRRKMKTVDLGNGVLLEGFDVPADGDCFLHSVFFCIEPPTVFPCASN